MEGCPARLYKSTMPEKECTKCGEIYPLGFFNRENRIGRNPSRESICCFCSAKKSAHYRKKKRNGQRAKRLGYADGAGCS